MSTAFLFSKVTDSDTELENSECVCSDRDSYMFYSGMGVLGGGGCCLIVYMYHSGFGAKNSNVLGSSVACAQCQQYAVANTDYDVGRVGLSKYHWDFIFQTLRVMSD